MWKRINDTNYYVSDVGEVKNKKGKLLKPSKTYNGYLRVNINGRLVRIHRIVAEAFIPNTFDLPQVNHKDGNKTNNTIDNLEWCTSSENIKHAYKIGLKKVSYDNIKECKPIVQLTVDNEIINCFDSIMEVERRYGYDNSSISKVCRGKQKTAYGYKWQYANYNK